MTQKIYSPSWICPYHPNVSYADQDQLNDHMNKSHWKGMDIHFKPTGYHGGFKNEF